MSSAAEHIALANRHQAVLAYLLKDLATCSEWAAVVAFYKSLHVVEAIFARNPGVGHVHTHHARLERIKREKQYQPFYPSFRALWSASIVARYLESPRPAPGAGTGKQFARFEDYLPVADLRPKLLDLYLVAFESMAVQMLPQTGPALNRYAPLPAQ
jgi:hypothetical protein